MKKWTDEQKKKLKVYWKSAMEAEDRFLENLDAIEVVMKKDLGVKELEFFWADGFLTGIGNQWDKPEDRYEKLQGEDLDG